MAPMRATVDLSMENQVINEQSNEQAGIHAFVNGQSVTALPKDLYIPPEALKVFLETFEGPLDLLLYLIKKHNLDILDIPIAHITKQYMEYVSLMQEIQFELAAEYLLMAAMLAEIKSRMLLPRPVSEEEGEDDPRAELVRRLQEYEQFKKAAEDLDALPLLGRDVFPVTAQGPDIETVRPVPEVSLDEVLNAFKDVMARAKLNEHHHIQMEPLSVRERMTIILDSIKITGFTDFKSLFNVKEGRQGVVVSFLAMLELLKQSLIEIVQKEPYSPIHIRAVTA